MITIHTIARALALLASLLVAQTGFAADRLVDSASFEYGGGDSVNQLRAGVQSDWEARWFAADGRHLSGYWDATVSYWRGDAYRNVPGQHQHIASVGFTPVFRYQRDDKRGWYAEAGIGVNLLSKLYDNNDDRLSTAFQFGDHLGVGYVLDNKWELGLKYQHFSNGSIKKPNSGVNFVIIKASYHF